MNHVNFDEQIDAIKNMLTHASNSTRDALLEAARTIEAVRDLRDEFQKLPKPHNETVMAEHLLVLLGLPRRERVIKTHGE